MSGKRKREGGRSEARGPGEAPVAAGAATHHERTDEGQLVMFLEPDQLVSDKQRPVPAARLGPRARAGLWALRIFGLVVSAMVIYTFFAQLGH